MKKMNRKNVLDLNKDDERNCEFAFHFLKKDVNEDKGNDVVERSTMKDRKKVEKLQEDVCGQMKQINSRGD